MNHLRAGVRFLEVVCHGHGVEFGLRALAAENARGVFPRDGRARLDLCPREAPVAAAHESALGD